MVLNLNKRVLKRSLILVNGFWIISQFYKNHIQKEKRKKDLDIGCKHILKKNPEILHYFGSINKIQMTSLSEINYKFLYLDLLNSAEFLIEGTKRTGKVSIRYYLSNPVIIKEFIKKQNENYEILLKMSDNKDEELKKDLMEYNFKNILRSNYVNEGNKSFNPNDGGNPVILNANKFPNFSTKDFEKKKSNGLFNNVFNFYYLNQYNTTAALKKIENSKVKEYESFINTYRKYLDKKFSSGYNDKNNVISEQAMRESNKKTFLPLLSYFLNFLEQKVIKEDQIDIFIQDIFIKKNFKYYSITPQNYDKNEYIGSNTLLNKEDSDFNANILNPKENQKLDVHKITSKFLKEKTIINQYSELAQNNKNDEEINNDNKLKDGFNDFEYEYNYPFIEEIFDSIQMDWRISYLMLASFLTIFYYIIYSLAQIRGYTGFEVAGKKILNYIRSEKIGNISNSTFFYFIWRTPLLLNSDRFIRFSVIDPAIIEKHLRTTFIVTQGNIRINTVRLETRSTETNYKNNKKF